MSSILDKSPWDSDAVFIIFIISRCILFKIFLHLSLPSIQYKMLKLGYTCLALSVGLREGIGMRIEKSPYKC